MTQLRVDINLHLILGCEHAPAGNALIEMNEVIFCRRIDSCQQECSCIYRSECRIVTKGWGAKYRDTFLTQCVDRSRRQGIRITVSYIIVSTLLLFQYLVVTI